MFVTKLFDINHDKEFIMNIQSINSNFNNSQLKISTILLILLRNQKKKEV